mmetsp:Transcript_70118/g.110725  ORF Transcript_70118/g.110725 Transcript_70118/m.110725 type:complete len:424 (-) Transcript_70118:37-1308(-)
MGCASSAPICQREASAHAVMTEFHDQYVLGVKIGCGTFAQVRDILPIHLKRRVRFSTEEAPISDKAVKIVGFCNFGTGEVDLKLQEHTTIEASLWKKAAGCSHIIQLYDVFFSSGLAYMVMERCCGDFYQHLDNSQELNEQFLRKVFLDMVTGIRQLHMRHMVHRDIKPTNFMIAADQNKTVKLGDFGLAARLPSIRKVHGTCGTAPFMCPEMLEHDECDEKADVWSLGVIAYVLLFGSFPYTPKTPNSKNMKKAITDGLPPPYEPAKRGLVGPASHFRSGSALEFVKALLKRDPAERPSAAAVLSRTYLNFSTPLDRPDGTQLPCLRSMLHAARAVGAFEAHKCSNVLDVDAELNQRQMMKHGEPLPESQLQGQKSAGASGLKVEAWEYSLREDVSNASTAVETDSSPDLSLAESFRSQQSI